MYDTYSADQIVHVVSHSRVFHVVVMPDGNAGYVGWCLEFPTLTRHGDAHHTVLHALSEQIDTVYSTST